MGGVAGMMVRTRGVSVSSDAFEGRGWTWPEVLSRVHEGSRHSVGDTRGGEGGERVGIIYGGGEARVDTDCCESERTSDGEGQGSGLVRGLELGAACWRVAPESDCDALSVLLEGRPVTLRPGV